LWRLFTASLLHYSFSHLFWNIFSLFMVGFVVESELKSPTYFVFLILLGSVAGNLLSAWTKPYAIGVGASATIYAMLGTLMVWVWLNF
jgi:rhomboid protease GluP